MPTQAPTLDQQRQQAVDRGRAIRDELVDLHAERGRLSLDAIAGKGPAVKRVAEIDPRVAELGREQRLAELAIGEADRRQAEAEATAALAERTRLEVEHADLSRRRDDHYVRIQTLTAQLVGEVEAALRLGADIHNAGTALGMTTIPERTSSRIYAYLATPLGPLAGLLRDFPVPNPALRGPLVEDGAADA